MAQRAIFPMEYLRVTQDENGATSHRGSLAQDHGGRSGAQDNRLLAPYDGTAARVRQDSSHETYFVSAAPVETPCGYVGVLTTTLMHDNVLDIATGQRRAQRQKIGDEGGFGRGRKDTFAHHAHLEVSKGRQTTQTKNKYGVYCTPGQMRLRDAFFLHPDTMVYTKTAGGVLQWRRAGDFPGGKAVDNCGHSWRVDTAAARPEETLQPCAGKRLHVTADNCQYFSAPDVNAALGMLGKDTLYDVTALASADTVLTAGGKTYKGRWCKFKLSAGERAEHYCLALTDRAQLVDKPKELTAGCTVQVDTAGSTLRVRTGPGTDFAALDSVQDKTSLKVLEVHGGWAYSKTAGGWLACAFLRVV